LSCDLALGWSQSRGSFVLFVICVGETSQLVMQVLTNETEEQEVSYPIYFFPVLLILSSNDQNAEKKNTAEILSRNILRHQGCHRRQSVFVSMRK
jgi:hypothetical protein